MNPETLRTWALSLHEQPNPDPVSVALAAADAWEKERAVFTHVAKERDLLRDARILDKAHAATLRQRLEAAEERLRECRCVPERHEPWPPAALAAGEET
jgi:primosomal protein N''